MTITRLGAAMTTLAGLGISALGCGGEEGPAAAEHWPVDAGSDTGAAAPEVGAPACTPSPRTSEDLTPRVDLINQAALGPSGQGPAPQIVQTSELFQRFKTICGSCHYTIASGGFQANESTFPTVFDASRLARIESNDPSFAMPPVGRAFSSRTADDPVVQLAKYLEAWLAQGRPVDMFEVQDSSMGSAAGAGFYAYSTLTNMGDCIPAKAMYASSPSSEMDSKDTMFAGATTLPDDLAETDLTTFDTAALAANGVIAFRPTYALWSAGSRKLRFIRVPKGTSIKFDKDKQTFDIPPNTRFYKTFFRQVLDSAGRTSFRKMETRLIVAKPDTLGPDGKPVQNALFGTYIWSADEMSARLRKVPYRDQDPKGFADLTAEYYTNEIEYQDLVANLAPGAGSLASKVSAELADPRHLGLLQHYAVPGSKRCIQCHQGSPGHNFVLGFLPLQIAQRAAGTGGTYDAVDADELDQLQRFIDYGLITGMASPADVARLEDSQLPRTARTDGELKAQAYMLGNCAHCHNPYGFPSQAKPELTTLNFLPGHALGEGIFQFPFDQMSPLRQRGASQNIPIPYITPSLRDYPVTSVVNERVDNGATIEPGADQNSRHEVTWTPKYGQLSPRACLAPGRDDRAYCGRRNTGPAFVAAPWRSLIYRNVDTPFPYFDDYVPFPHMPMNTAGFDCRAPRIMGDWMVGLPAILKPDYQGLSEDAIPDLKLPDGTYVHNFIDAPQPYQEVTRDDPYYGVAVASANTRLDEYHTSSRYPYCPDVLSPDILDPVGLAGQPFGTARVSTVFYPRPERYLLGGLPPSDPNHPGEYIQPAIGVPYHAEWFDYDPTDDPPPWQPRRVADWQKVLVLGLPDTSLPAGQVDNKADPDASEARATDRRRLVAAIQSTSLTEELRAYAITAIPYGIWEPKTECADKLATSPLSQTKVSDLNADQIPWVKEAGSKLSPDARVYSAAPGFTIFRHVCFNCHGAKADGKGLQGDALAASSEGRTRPANLSGGLFGPSDMLGSNLVRVFNVPTDETRSLSDEQRADLWGSRYLAWMTLGGTLQLIPQDVVNQVQATTILGVKRQHLQFLPAEAAGVSANMLNLAKGLCAEVLPDKSALSPTVKAENPFDPAKYPLLNDKEQAAFITTNGDWEMWMNLCSRFNRPVIRVYGLQDQGLALVALYRADGDAQGNSPFPDGQPVWDHARKVRMGLGPDNFYPACFQGTAQLSWGGTPPTAAAVAAYRADNPGLTMPDCPQGFLANSNLVMLNPRNPTPDQQDAVKEWTLRGAINAGMAVFSFLKQADLGNKPLPLYYNECQLLP